jgi:hypothetical protein
MAETTKSPVFSSPSYWVALGAGVVGIAAAAMQERTGSGSAARGGNFGGMDEAEWHDDFFARYGRNTLTRLNRIAHEAELHYRPKDDPGYWGGMGTYRSMYDRILSGAKSYGIDERAAKAYASARGFYPEPKSKRRY